MAIMLAVMNIAAQEKKEGYVVNSFWSNWFVQAGLDMSLQNPYGHEFGCRKAQGGATTALPCAFLPMKSSSLRS